MDNNKKWDGKSWRELKRKAERNGWTIPVNDVFSQEAWVQYWQRCELAKKGLIEGRPVAPHRTGGSI